MGHVGAKKSGYSAVILVMHILCTSTTHSSISDLLLGARSRRLVGRPPFRPQCDATDGCDWNLCGRFRLLHDLYSQKLVKPHLIYKISF